MKLHPPSELQSPKIIIEEQMDKVVTNMGLYSSQPVSDQPRNDIYPMNDGSSLLERALPEAITTTTIAKETFIVRPANGDIYSKVMDISHGPIQHPTYDYNDGSPPNSSNNTHDDPSWASIQGGDSDNTKGTGRQTHDASESIVLDIAGYKTGGDQEWEEDQVDTHDLSGVTGCEGISRTMDQLEIDTKSASLWGWGASGQPSTSINDVNEESSTPGVTYRFEMSLCGLSAFKTEDDTGNVALFDEHQLTYDTFMKNPNVLNDRRLVFRYEGRYYGAGYPGPLFTSLLLFKKPLPVHNTPGFVSDAGSKGDVEDNRESYLFGKGWRQWLSRSSLTGPQGMDALSTGGANDQAADDGVSNATTDLDDMTTRFTTSTKATTLGWHSEQRQSNNAVSSDPSPQKHYAKTLRLTSEQLKQLGLNKGVNTITFSVTSAYQGTAICAAKIFYWDYDMPIVISDIDGTITKSDALGHVFTMIGKDWTHHGVAKLYTDICNNGYNILYLTSRAIGQSDYTRDYLKKVEQGPFQLPDGPVILSPDRLFTSFHREIIMRKPEVFKMACLKDIQRLFGGRDPFYAGFGNRVTDAISYRSVHVPASRIFTIDPNGLIKLELLKGFTSSYLHLNDLVDHIFPPVNTKTVVMDEDYNDWNYWKQPLPAVELPEDTKKSPLLVSTKVKPIKPDLTSLPLEAVVESEQQQQQHRGGLLRSLTSLSSSSSSSLVDSGGRQASLAPQRSHTTPTISTRRSRVQSFTDTLRRPSLLLGSLSPSTSDNQQQSPPTSPSLMSHLSLGIDEVRHSLSKKLNYDPPSYDLCLPSPPPEEGGHKNSAQADDFDPSLDDLEETIGDIPFF
jgi:phosphatidate phosphatase LPIN